jgi:hypothetical protein
MVEPPAQEFASLRPFHDIKVRGGRLNDPFLFEKTMFKLHIFGDYKNACTIIVKDNVIYY